MACQAAHGSPGAAAACLLLSYPLHPPLQPAALRDSPLVDLPLPLLLVRGTRDPFSRQPQWDALLPRLASRKPSVHLVEGGDHSFRVRGGEEACAEALEGALAAAQAFLAEVVQQPGHPAGRAEAGARASGGPDATAAAAAGHCTGRGSRKRPR